MKWCRNFDVEYRLCCRQRHCGRGLVEPDSEVEMPGADLVTFGSAATGPVQCRLPVTRFGLTEASGYQAATST